MEQVLANLKKRYEADLAKLQQQEQSLRKQLEDVVSRIFSFRGAIEAVGEIKTQTTPAPEAAQPTPTEGYSNAK